MNQIQRICRDFLKFLHDNFVESEYLNQLSIECSDLLEFYENLKIGENKEIKNMNIFSDVTSEILESYIKKDKKIIRNEILEYFEKYYSKEKEYKNIPFLPEFYDIAYDYIKYPSTTSEITELLNNMTF